MIDIEVQSRSLVAAYQAAPELYASNLRTRLRTIGARLVRGARAKAGNDTGRLRRSIRSRIELDPATQSAQVRVYAGTWYGRLQEAGGTIKPRRASALAVPLEGGRALGVGARAFLEAPAAHGFRTGFIYNDVVFGKRADVEAVVLGGLRFDQSSLVPLFVLKPSVTIRPKWFLRSTFLAQRAAMLEDLRGGVNESTAQVAALSRAGVVRGGGGLL